MTAKKRKTVQRAVAANKVVASIKAKTSLSELIAAAEAIIIESGGDPNPDGTKWHLLQALATAEAMGVLKVTRPTDVTIERVK